MLRFFIVLTSLVFFSCSNTIKLTEEEMRTIAHESNAKLEKAFLSKDLSGLADIYDENARLSPNGDHFYAGRDEIRGFWKTDFESSTLLKMNTNTMSVSGNAEVIYETGITTTESMLKDSSIYKGAVKFINVWKRQPDNSYRLAIDFWNSGD